MIKNKRVHERIEDNNCDDNDDTLELAPDSKKLKLDHLFNLNIFTYDTFNLDEFNLFTKSRLKLTPVSPDIQVDENLWIHIIKNTYFELAIKFSNLPELILDSHNYNPADRYIINNVMNNHKDTYIYNGTFMSRVLPKNKLSYLKSIWNRKNLAQYNNIYNIEYVRFKLVMELTDQVPGIDISKIHVTIN